MGKYGLHAHVVFGDTNRADGVPDSLVPDDGPVYLEGRLVLSLSFQGGPADVRTEDAGELIERYRLWDDLAGEWHGGLEVLRFEWADVVVCLGPKPAVLCKGCVQFNLHIIRIKPAEPVAGFREVYSALLILGN